jgi:hypothetical protein
MTGSSVSSGPLFASDTARSRVACGSSGRPTGVTTIKVEEPAVLGLTDPELWEDPWIYLVKASNIEFTDPEVGILREFPLRGGTATCDDFHGPAEWDLIEHQPGYLVKSDDEASPVDRNRT